MAKDRNAVQNAQRRRPAVAARAVVSGSQDVAVKKPFNPVQFLREVRVEARKVTWTSWKETWITSVMVGIMVVMTALFFFALDWILGIGVAALLKLANAE